ncbi:MAG TPA: hypothetical protein VEW71_09060 [Allosphingosinicella sp.]|nr:hypothetical protein [Allosphingosinicella sp.]
MGDPTTMITLASASLAGLSIATFAGLRGWQGWLEVKRLELAGTTRREGRSPAGDMIEMADLKERVRKLESIASCIDL